MPLKPCLPRYYPHCVPIEDSTPDAPYTLRYSFWLYVVPGDPLCLESGERFCLPVPGFQALMPHHARDWEIVLRHEHLDASKISLDLLDSFFDRSSQCYIILKNLTNDVYVLSSPAIICRVDWIFYLNK